MKNADFTDAFTQIYLRKALLSLKNWVSVKVKAMKIYSFCFTTFYKTINWENATRYLRYC